MLLSVELLALPMSTVAAFFVFVLIMLALATLAIILDWMGKPIRRSFRPRTTGTPAWLAVDAPMSAEPPDAPFAIEPAALAQPQPAAVPGPWQAGDSIFKLTPRGTPPSITAVRRRYWKNLSEHRASVLFGEANQSLMAIGQAPQRFNPRTSAIEELQLPEPMLRRCWTTGRKPSPTWGDQGLDPYARP
ncbi:MAG: hypothetical protein OXN79_11260 [bacterium]|nr:hypothetical protein [bacterium]